MDITSNIERYVACISIGREKLWFTNAHENNSFNGNLLYMSIWKASKYR
jgi:hypothetical protein